MEALDPSRAEILRSHVAFMPVTSEDRRTHVCLSSGERLMMLNAVIKGFEAFVVEQDLQGKMMAAFVLGILLKCKDLKCLQTASWKWSQSPEMHPGSGPMDETLHRSTCPYETLYLSTCPYESFYRSTCPYCLRL
ncbi:hypothetical protein F2P79_023682 [Pimephales promelas]|nr:hypothetical protein F2P79_023682 [Pimephales promelas]